MKSNQMYTLFRTESGLTQFTISRHNPLFSTLLSMYDGHEVPNSIILSGSVGEVFDEEYNIFLSRSNTIVPLSKVRRILRILDVQSEDLIRIHADDQCDRDERFHHYSLVGYDLSLFDKYMLSSLVMGRLGVLILELYTRLSETEEVDMRVIRGAIHNAIIASKPYEEDTFSPESIRWDDFLYISESNNVVRTTDPLRLLAGCGTLDSNDLVSPSWLRNVLQERKGRKSLRFIYQKYLDIIPNDTSLVDLGCSPLASSTFSFQKQVALPTNNIVQAMNTHFSLRIIGCIGMDVLIREQLEESSSLIGREGIRRILIALKSKNSASLPAITFLYINLMEEYLEGKKRSSNNNCIVLTTILILILLAIVRWYAM